MKTLQQLAASWESLAQELGMTFKPGIELFIESPNLLQTLGLSREIQVRDVKHLQKLCNLPLIGFTYRNMFIGNVVGSYKDYEVHLLRSPQTEGKKRTAYYVNIYLLFKSVMPYELEIKKRGWITPLLKKIFRQKYATIPGDPVLDKKLSIKTNNLNQVRNLLFDGVLVDKLRTLFETSPYFIITKTGIRWKRIGDEINKETFLYNINLMADTASRFYF